MNIIKSALLLVAIVAAIGFGTAVDYIVFGLLL